MFSRSPPLQDLPHDATLASRRGEHHPDPVPRPRSMRRGQEARRRRAPAPPTSPRHHGRCRPHFWCCCSTTVIVVVVGRHLSWGCNVRGGVPGRADEEVKVREAVPGQGGWIRRWCAQDLILLHRQEALRRGGACRLHPT